MIGQKSKPSKNTLRKRKNKKRTLYKFIHIYTHHVVKDWKLEECERKNYSNIIYIRKFGFFCFVGLLFVCFLFHLSISVK